MILKTIFLLLIPLIYSQCLPGTYFNTTGGCSLCPPGTFSTGSVGINSCQLCPSGSFQRFPGSPNCTICSLGANCPAGSVFELKSSDYLSTIIDPSTPIIVQNYKIGFVFVLLLVFVVPLIAFCFTCWSDDLCGFFDFVYSEKHFLQDGEARIKRKTACGGFCFLLVASFFTMVVGAVIVDYYWGAVIRVGKLSPSFQIGRNYPFGVNQNQKVELRILGITQTDCYATFPITSGYIVGLGGSLNITSTYNSAPDPNCYIVMNCNNCSLSMVQTLIITLPRERVFAQRIFYTYSVSHFGNWYSVNASIAAPSGQVFSGPNPTVISLTVFPAYLNFLNGGEYGGAQWTQWVNTFVRDIRTLYQGLVFQVESVTPGSTVQNLTGQGISIQINGNFSPLEYHVDEILLQTVWDHIAELVALALLFIVVGYLLLSLWEYSYSIYQYHQKNGNIPRIKKAFIRPFRAIWKSFINLFKQEKDDIWASEEEEEDEDKEKLKDEDEKIEDTNQVLERLKKQIVELETRLKPEDKKQEKHDKKEENPVEERSKSTEIKDISKHEENNTLIELKDVEIPKDDLSQISNVIQENK